MGYSRAQICAIKSKYANIRGNKTIGRKADGMYSTCIHCKKDDATFIKRRTMPNTGGGKSTGVHCIRCNRHAGM